jgi:hypothetical protein
LESLWEHKDVEIFSTMKTHKQNSLFRAAGLFGMSGIRSGRTLRGAVAATLLLLLLATSAKPERVAPRPAACAHCRALRLRGGVAGREPGDAAVGSTRDRPEQPKGRRIRQQPWRISDYEQRREARVRR